MIGEVKITQSDNSMNCAVKVNSRSSRKSEVKTTFLKKKKKKKKKILAVLSLRCFLRAFSIVVATVGYSSLWYVGL